MQVLVADASPFSLSLRLQGSGSPSDTGEDGPLVITADGQPITAQVNLTISVVPESVNQLLSFMRGRDAISTSDVTQTIRGELLTRVLALELGQHTVAELRGNEELRNVIHESLSAELASTLDGYGFWLDDFYVDWGPTHTERESIEEKLHEARLRAEERRRELDTLSYSRLQGEAERTPPSDAPPIELDQQDQAIEANSEALGLNPHQEANYYYFRGNDHSELGQYEQAIQDYDEAIRLDPHDASYYSSRASAHSETGRYEQAIQDYSKAIGLDPLYFHNHALRGAAHLELSQHEQAIREFDEAIRLYPQDAPVYGIGVLHALRGATNAVLDQHGQAVEDYSEAISLNPQDPGHYYSRGNAYSELGQYHQAIRDYDKAVELDPHDANTYIQRADAHGELDEYEQAVLDLDQAISLDPQNSMIEFKRSLFSLKALLASFNRIIQDCDDAISLDPRNASAFARRGYAYSELEQHERAIQDFDEAIRLDPQQINAYVDRGTVFFQLEQHESAVQDFNEAIKLDPQHVKRVFPKY